MKECMLQYLKKTIAFVLVVGMLISSVPNLMQLVHAADVTADVSLFTHSGNGANGFYISISPGDSLATKGWTKYKGNCVYVNGELKENVPLFKVDSQIYFVGLVDGNCTATTDTTVKIEGTLTDGTNSVTFNSVSFQYQEDGKWHKVLPKTEVTVANHASNSGGNGNYIYFTVTPAIQLEGKNWTAYKCPVISINGGEVRSDIPIRNVLNGGYVVDLYGTDLQDVSKDGMTIKLEGDLTDGKQVLRLESTEFLYNETAGKWEKCIPSQEVTISDHAANGNGNGNYIYFTVAPAIQLEGKNWTAYKCPVISINGGEVRSDIPIRNVLDGSYVIDLYGTDLQDVSKDGMTIKLEGDLTDGQQIIRFEATEFRYNGTASKWELYVPSQEPEVQEVTIADYAANANGNDKYIYFKISPAITLATPNKWKDYYGEVLSVNGGEIRADIPIRSVGDGVYVVDLYGTDLENVSKDGMKIKLEGDLTDGEQAIRMVATEFCYNSSSGKWEKFIEPTKVTTSLDKQRKSTTDGIYIVVTPTDSLPSAESWKIKYSGECVYVNDELNTKIKMIKILPDVYYVDLASASVSVIEGTKIKLSGTITDGTYAVEFLEKTYVYTLDNGWEVDGSIPTVTIVNKSLNMTNAPALTIQGLYFDVTAQDSLSFTGWNVYRGDCVYVDGKLIENAKVIKAGDSTYYVALVDMDIVPVAGTVVKVAGILSDGINSVRFASHEFVYQASGDWVDHKTQYLATAIAKTSATEIWINSIGTDNLDFADTDNNGSGWKGYSGIVYVNGNLTSTKIYKNLSDLYVIYASELGVTVADGLQVKVMGALDDKTNQIYYLPITFEYSDSAGKWLLVRNASTDVPGDANADGKFSVADVVRAKYEEQMGDASKRLVSEGALYEDAFGKKSVNVKKLYEIALVCEDGVPVYADDDTIMIAAYEGPKVAGSILYDKGVQSDTLNAELTQEDFNQFARAGLNTLIIESPTFVSVSGGGDYDLMGSGGGHWNILANHMEKAANANLNVIASSEALNSYLWEEQATHANGTTKIDVTDTFLQRDLRQLLTGMVEQSSGQYRIAKGMLEYNNFKGILMGDELPYEHLDAYEKAHDILEELDNSVPTFNSQFAGINNETGKSWAEEFGPIAGTFCYDMYPHVKDGSMKKDWLYNLQLSAAAGLEHGFTTGITLQAHGQTISRTDLLVEDTSLGLRNPNEKDDIGFQVYTSLAYGMKYLSYYTYAPHRHQSNKHYYTGTMIEYDENQNIVETDTYRAVQAVNNEILQFDHVFLDYDWRGTIGISKQNKDELFGQLDNYSTSLIGTYEATHDALIGCMYDPDKKLNGYWLVNAVDPQDNQSNEVTVEFIGKTRVIVYNPSEGIYGQIHELNNHTYTAELGSGEGQFVIPLP